MFRRVVVAALACLATVTAGEHIQYKIRNGELPSRAVNLGGWLVSEYWMSFSSPLYKGVSSTVGLKGEYAVMELLGKEQGDKQAEQHWATFITETDIAQIAKAGLNTVRVTTGFWIINDVDKNDTSALTASYASGGLKYLDKLINVWAVKYNLAVMISLHAHRGSQNAFDNSAPAVDGEMNWAKDQANVDSSLNYATFIAHRYKNSPAFLGLNLMNEPKTPIDLDVLQKFYKDAYAAIRADGNDCIIVLSPWLERQGPPFMADFMTCPDYYNVWHEWHIYYKWGWEGVSKKDVFAAAADYSNSKYKPWTGNPIYLGEWSLATTDEFNLTRDEWREFAAIQMKQAELAGAGWAFWSWRHDEEATKDPSGWSMRQLINESVIEIPTTAVNRTRNPLCKVVESHDLTASSGSESTSDSGSGSGNTSLELNAAITDKAAANNSTTATTTEAPKATTSAAIAAPLLSASVVTATLLTWAAL